MRIFIVCTIHLIYYVNNANYVVRTEECRSAFKIVTGKPTGKRPLGRLRHRWEYNITRILKK